MENVNRTVHHRHASKGLKGISCVLTVVKQYIGTLRYTTARRYYGYHDRKGLGKSTSRQSAKFSVRSKINCKEAQSKEWKVTFI